MLAIWLGATVGVLNFHFRGHKLTAIPNWLKCVLFMKKNPNINNSLTDEQQKYELNTDDEINNNNNNIGNNLKVKDDVRRTQRQLQTPSCSVLTETNMDKILKIMKIYIHKLDRNSTKSKRAEKIAIEWKEAARRIDLICFVLVTTTVTVLPIYLFGKFMTNEYTIVNRVCSCF